MYTKAAGFITRRGDDTTARGWTTYHERLTAICRKIALFYRGIKRIHIDMDDFPHISRSFISVDCIPVYGPPDITFPHDTFHPHPIAALTHCLVIFPLYLPIPPN